MSYMLLFSLLSPVFAAVLIYFRNLSRRDQTMLAVLSLLLSFILIGSMLPAVISSGIVNEEYPWISQMSISFDLHMDGLSFVMASLILLIGSCSIIFSYRYIKKEPEQFNALLLLLITGMLGVVLSGNLIIFYLFWEAMIVPAYLLIVRFGEGERRADTGLKFFIFMQIGALMMLFCFVNIYMLENTFDMSIITGSGIPTWLPVILFIAFATKMGIFPFHNWLPDAYADAPSPVSALMSGMMTGLGAYAIIRVIIITLNAELHPAISVIALLSMIYGAVMALSQSDIKRLLAYSTISQMGFVLLGLTYGVSGIVGGSLHIVSHALAKSSLFFAAGLIIYTTGKREFGSFGGMLKQMPKPSIAMLISALALCGLPPMLPYVSEVFIFEPVLVSDMLMASLGILAGAITIIYFAILIDKTLFSRHRKIREQPVKSMAYPMYLLSLLLIFFGLLPDIILRLITIMG